MKLSAANVLLLIFENFMKIQSLEKDIVLLVNSDIFGCSIAQKFLKEDITSSLTSVQPFPSCSDVDKSFTDECRISKHQTTTAVVFILQSGTTMYFGPGSRKLDIHIDEDVVWGLINNESLQLWDHYTVKSQIFTRKIADKVLLGLDIKFIVEYIILRKVNRRFNLEGLTLSGIIRSTDFIPEKDGQKGANLLRHTVSFVRDCFLDIGKLLNFTYELTAAQNAENHLLSHTTNSTNNVADIGVFFLGQTLKRFKIFTLLQPLQKARYYMYFKKPRLNSIQNAHFHPFKIVAWGSLLLTWIAFAMLLFVVKYLQLEGSSHNDICIWWWIISLVSGKHPNIDQRYLNRTLKVFFVTGALLGMMIQIFYSSCILSSIKVLKSPIKNFDNLIDHGFSVTTHNRSQPLQGILMNALKRRQLNGESLRLVENDHQISHLLQDRISTLAYSDTFLGEAVKQNYSKSFLCETISSVPMTSNDKPFPASFVLRKNSEFTKLFNYGLLHLKERGLHYRYHYTFDLFQSRFACDDIESNISWDTVDVTDTFVPFSILGFGFLIALSAFGYEKLRGNRDYCKVRNKLFSNVKTDFIGK